MKNKNLLLGIILLFVGVIALLASLDVFEFRWSIVWHLWPLLLIIFGIMVLPVKDWLKVIMLLVSLAGGILLYRYELSQGWLQGLFSLLL
mgnify:FL=1|jgi:hypothetical protein